MIEPLAYSLRQAAEACGLSVATLGRAVRAGQLRAKLTTLPTGDPPAVRHPPGRARALA